MTLAACALSASRFRSCRAFLPALVWPVLRWRARGFLSCSLPEGLGAGGRLDEEALVVGGREMLGRPDKGRKMGGSGSCEEEGSGPTRGRVNVPGSEGDDGRGVSGDTGEVGEEGGGVRGGDSTSRSSSDS
jgi:hypothetical protein